MNGPQKVESPAPMVLPSGTIPQIFKHFQLKTQDFTSILRLPHHCDRSHIHSAAGEANSSRGAVPPITGSQRHVFLTAHFSYTAI